MIYPYFDVSLNLERNIFRFINLDKKPGIENSIQAISLLSDLQKIVSNEAVCLVEGVSLPIIETIKFLVIKERELEREFRGLSFFSKSRGHTNEFDFLCRVFKKIVVAKVIEIRTRELEKESQWLIKVSYKGDKIFVLQNKIRQTMTELRLTLKKFWLYDNDNIDYTGGEFVVLSNKVSLFVTKQFEIMYLGDALQPIFIFLDVKDASSFLRTCKRIYDNNVIKFSQQFAEIKPELVRQLQLKVEAQKYLSKRDIENRRYWTRRQEAYQTERRREKEENEFNELIEWSGDYTRIGPRL